MAFKINPFRPNSPINPGMFVGRLRELNALEAALLQTRASQPKNFMVTGERGIGKTSLLDYIRYVANGDIKLASGALRFLVIATDVQPSTTQISLIQRIERGFDRALTQTEQARSFLREAWEFIRRLEVGGVKLREDAALEPEVILDDFAYSVAKVTKRLCDSSTAPSLFGTTYDGVLLLIDECDKASKDLDIGAFLKLLLERVQRHDCYRFMVGIAGLDNLRDVLYVSHESSLRLFDELRLDRLSTDEVHAVIDVCLRTANQTNAAKVSIDEEGRTALVELSEGYPHFIQQLGFCAFEQDDDGVITNEDVTRGAVGNRGALDRIGDRYYRDDFYNRIQKDSYRRVLRIMADKLDDWITKQEIRAQFAGKDTTLDNAIHALRSRNIIQSKEGARGVYRLQNKAFALWIKLYTTDQAELGLGEPHEGAV
jgi:hypothetical protein